MAKITVEGRDVGTHEIEVRRLVLKELKSVKAELAQAAGVMYANQAAVQEIVRKHGGKVTHEAIADVMELPSVGDIIIDTLGAALAASTGKEVGFFGELYPECALALATEFVIEHTAFFSQLLASMRAASAVVEAANAKK